MSAPARDTVASTHPWWVWVPALLIPFGTIGANYNDRADGPPIVSGLIALASLVPILLPEHRGEIPLLRWAPAASGAVLAAYFFAGFSDGPIFIALPLVTLVVARRLRVREWWPGVAAGIVMACTSVAASFGSERAHDDAGGFWAASGLAALTIAAGAIGTALRNRREAQAERAERAATEEQLRMAQDLHDGVGHGLAVIAMQAGVALHVLDSDPGKARASLQAIRDTSKESLATLRAELAGMTGAEAPHTPAPGLDDLPALADRVRSAGLVVEIHRRAGEIVSPAVGGATYAVAQEALTNVLRHANATRADVTVDAADDTLRVTIEDDGVGAAPATEGLGLQGMRRRIESLGGTFSAGPGESGFDDHAEVPL